MTGRRLTELSITRRTGAAWLPLEWGTCEECSDTLAGFAMGDQALWDGDDLVCLGCGLVHVACLDDHDEEDVHMTVLATTVEPLLLESSDLAQLRKLVAGGGQ